MDNTKKPKRYRHLPAFILLILAEEPVHGGAVYTKLCSRLDNFQADNGAVYRTLQQLEKEGSVIADWDTSGTGAARKIYRITPVGWQVLEYWKQDIEHRLVNLNYFINTYKEMIDNRKTKIKE